MLDRVVRLTKLNDRFTAAKEYLEDVQGTKQLKLKNETTCSECGKIFPLTTMADKGNFQNHLNMHFFENFPCECKKTWNSLRF